MGSLSRFRGAGVTFGVGALLALAVPGSPDAARAAERDTKPVTVVYDVSELLSKGGTKTGFDRIDDLVQLLLTTVDPESWNDGKKGGNTLQVLSDTKLEVTAGAAQHTQIADLLAAQRRATDLAVDVHAELIELEHNYFAKEVKHRLKTDPEGKVLLKKIDEELAAEIRKNGQSLRANETRIPQGKEAAFLSQRGAFTYAIKPVEGKPPVGVGFHGVTLLASVNVSPDRRFVTLKVTQQVKELVGLKRQVVEDKGAMKSYAVEEPKLTEASSSSTIKVDDGEWVATQVPYSHPADKKKNLVRVLLIRPAIYIEAEEQERLREKQRQMKP